MFARGIFNQEKKNLINWSGWFEEPSRWFGSGGNLKLGESFDFSRNQTATFLSKLSSENAQALIAASM